MYTRRVEYWLKLHTFLKWRLLMHTRKDFGCTEVKVLSSVKSLAFLCVTGSSGGSHQGQTSQQLIISISRFSNNIDALETNR